MKNSYKTFNIVLKSGVCLKIKAKRLVLDFNKTDLSIAGYHFMDIKKRTESPLHIVASEISAVTYK